MTETTDDASAAELRERVDDLEAQVEDISKTVQQTQASEGLSIPSPSRRSLLKGGLGVALLGAATGSASAASGTIGSDSLRYNWFSETLNNINYVEPQATASEGSSYTADLKTANYHKVTLTGDVSFDFSNVDSSDTNSVILHLVQDSTGGRTPSFTPTVVWDAGSAPSWSTSANAEDVVTLVHDQDGSQWLGFVGGLGMA